MKKASLWIQNRERALVWALIFAALCLSNWPYFVLWLTPPPQSDLVWTGLLAKIDDQNVHLSWARQAYEGHFFARNLFSTEGAARAETPLFFNGFSWLLGTVARVSGLPILLFYHAFRALGLALTLWIFHRLSERMLPLASARIWALALVALGGGMALFAPLFPFSGLVFIDRATHQSGGKPLLMPEAFTLFSGIISPLFIVSIALLAAVYLGLDSSNRRVWRWLSPLCALVLANIHSYDAIPLLLALILWPLVSPKTLRSERFKRATPSILAALAPLIYQVWVFAGSAEFREKALVPTPPPAPWNLALSYGWLLIFGIWGAVICWRRDQKLVPLWALSTLICLYLPVSFGRKMIEGVHLPLVLLAILGVISLPMWRKSRRLRFVVCATSVMLALGSSLQFIDWTLRDARRDTVQNLFPVQSPAFLTRGDAAALRFLANQKAAPQDAVLCWAQLGNHIPGQSGKLVFVGHWAETRQPENKLRQTAALLSAEMAPEAARQFLRENRIRWVVTGQVENFWMASHGTPDFRALGLKPVFQAGGTTVYEVVDGFSESAIP